MDSLFESKEALDFYQKHPLHVEIASTLVRLNVSARLSFDELEECIPMPDESVSELSYLLTAFLDGEGETDRVLFMGRYWFHCSVAQLATRMSLTPNAVSLRLYKTRERLRIYLNERGYHV